MPITERPDFGVQDSEMREIKLRISEERLADFIQGTPRQGGVWSPTAQQIQERPLAVARARRMLAADALYEVASLAVAYLQGGTVKRKAKEALALADAGEEPGK